MQSYQVLYAFRLLHGKDLREGVENYFLYS